MGIDIILHFEDKLSLNKCGEKVEAHGHMELNKSFHCNYE